MQKVLYYIDTPHPGGAANQLSLLARELDRSVFEPLVVCGASPELDEWVAALTSGGVRVVRLSITRARDVKAIPELMALIAQEQPTLAHLHLSHSGSCRQAFLACARAHVPVVATEHDPFALSTLKHIVKKLTLRSTAHTIALSHGNKEFLMQQYGLPDDQITVVHNGIDAHVYEDIVPLDTAALGIPDEHIIIATIVELHPRKDVTSLLTAVPIIAADYPHVSFIIAGDGEEREMLTAAAPQNVHFIGRVADIKPLLATSDIYALPSKREAFGLTILEAMAAHVPVVATSTDGPRDIVTPGETGVLFPPQDPTALATALLHLIHHPHIRKEIAAKAHKMLLERFTAKHMARATESVYTRLLTPR